MEGGPVLPVYLRLAANSPEKWGSRRPQPEGGRALSGWQVRGGDPDRAARTSADGGAFRSGSPRRRPLAENPGPPLSTPGKVGPGRAAPNARAVNPRKSTGTQPPGCGPELQ